MVVEGRSGVVEGEERGPGTFGTASTGPVPPKGPGSMLLLPKSEPERGRERWEDRVRFRFGVAMWWWTNQEWGHVGGYNKFDTLIPKEMVAVTGVAVFGWWVVVVKDRLGLGPRNTVLLSAPQRLRGLWSGMQKPPPVEVGFLGLWPRLLVVSK